MRRFCLGFLIISSVVNVAPAAENEPPAGFRSLFNGKNLDGWYGASTEDPRKMASLTPEERAEVRAKSRADINEHWTVDHGLLVNDGFGLFLTTEALFGDYELFVSYKTVPLADSGIYLKGDATGSNLDHKDEKNFVNGCEKGSGGLWNNSAGQPGKDPLVFADRPLGEWNTFRIRQIGARTTVFLNGKLVVDYATLENFFDRKKPLIARGPIQLQTHGGEIHWKDIFIRDIPPAEANSILANDGFTAVFDGTSLKGWTGAVENYEVVDGTIRCKPEKGGVLHTSEEFGDFIVRLEFKVPPGGNNGLAIRYSGKGNAAYDGMTELQVLDDDAPKHADLDPRQYHGSSYGMVPATRGYHRAAGEWNFEEVTVVGSKIKVELNGSIILDADLSAVTEFMANTAHPGKDRTQGYFGFAGHNDPVEFRNIRIKELSSLR